MAETLREALLVDKTLLGFLDDLNSRGDEAALAHRPRLRTHVWAGRQVAHAVPIFARNLESRGIAKGDRVLLWGSNSPEWVAALFGCVNIGAIAVPLDMQPEHCNEDSARKR
jgi:acyl-CoA synthetase (AMP-forming)/AMP-acid ligase II